MPSGHARPRPVCRGRPAPPGGRASRSPAWEGSRREQEFGDSQSRDRLALDARLWGTGPAGRSSANPAQSARRQVPTGPRPAGVLAGPSRCVRRPGESPDIKEPPLGTAFRFPVLPAPKVGGSDSSSEAPGSDRDATPGRPRAGAPTIPGAHSIRGPHSSAAKASG
jgi:hypothetical protein